MKVLPDTSVWVGFLRKGAPGRSAELDRLLRNDAVVVCGPVVAELLAGTPRSRRHDVWLGVGSLPWADVDRDGWHMAGDLAAALRSKGKTLPLTDIVIAVACMTADVELWTHDADFTRIRSVAPRLKLYQPVG